MRGLDAGMKSNVVPLPMPEIPFIGQEIMHFVMVASDFAEQFHWRLDIPALGVEWIEIYDDQNDAIARRRNFAVAKQRFVIDRMKAQVVVELECAILAPDSIQF